MTTTGGANLPSVTIDDNTYLLEDLSEPAQQLVASLATAQQELNRLQALAGITQTAIAAYGQALKQEIEANAGSSIG
jgi:hypothetical protein